MRIITVSRELGSGGREVGKRLADALHMAYYDKEILTKLAEETDLDEGYVAHMLERASAVQSLPLTFSRTLNQPGNMFQSTQLLGREHRIIRELAQQGDCVIVGRSADAILEDMKPFKLFVYADMEAKIARCRARAASGEALTDKENEKRMRQVDKSRAANHDFSASYPWGDKAHYNLCLNTTGLEIKAIVPQLAGIIENWFQKNAE